MRVDCVALARWRPRLCRADGGSVNVEDRGIRGRREAVECGLGDSSQALGGEQHLGAGVPEDRGHLRRLIVGVERHDHSGDGENGEVGCAPVRVVVGEDRAAIAGVDSCATEPVGPIEGQTVELRVGISVESVLPLNFDRDAIAEAFDGRFEDAQKATRGRL